MKKHSDAYEICGTEKEELVKILKEKFENEVLLKEQEKHLEFQVVFDGSLLEENQLETYPLSVYTTEEASADAIVEARHRKSGSNIFIGVAEGNAIRYLPLSYNALGDLAERITGSGKVLQTSPQVQKSILQMYRDNANDQQLQMLISEGKVRGIKSKDYVYLPQDKILTAVLKGLENQNVPASVKKWNFSHDLTEVVIKVGDEVAQQAMAAYVQVLRNVSAKPVHPNLYLYLQTSDTGCSSVHVDVFMQMNDSRFKLGDGLDMRHHTKQCSLKLLEEHMSTLFARTNNLVDSLSGLTELVLEHPDRCICNAGARLGFPEGHVLQAIDEVLGTEREDIEVTAHDLFLVLSRALTRVKADQACTKATEIRLMENMARILLPNWDWNAVDTSVAVPAK